jgi:hypothetical protein
MNIHGMTTDEVRAEAARRHDRVQRGLPLADDTPAAAPPGLARPWMRSEKEEELRCDQLVAREAGASVHFSQARAPMQTPGIPDRRYRLGGIAFFWEVKRADGKLSAEQDDFIDAEVSCGCLCGAGTSDDLEPIVLALAKGWPLKSVTQMLAESVERVRARGPR